MSNNASRNTTSAIRRASSAAEEWDLSPANLNELEAEARRERRMDEEPHSAFARYVSANGLGKLVQPVVEWFEYKAETQLPHNLIYSEMSGSVGIVGAYGRKLELHEANAEMERFARFGGWLRAAAELPALRKVITKTQSARGINSPYTVIDLWDFAKRYPSPGKLEYKLRKVRRNADAIMLSFGTTQKASWASIAQGMMTSRQPNRAAIVAVAISLSGDSSLRGYGRAREWLVDYHLCKVVDKSDGVEARREQTPRLSKLGVDVYRIAIPRQTRRGRKVGVNLQWLVCAADGRTYHDQWVGSYPHEALRYALRAWKDQREVSKEALRDNPFAKALEMLRA